MRNIFYFLRQNKGFLLFIILTHNPTNTGFKSTTFKPHLASNINQLSTLHYGRERKNSTFYAQDLFRGQELANKRCFTSSSVYKTKDEKRSSVILEQLKQGKYLDHFDHKNEMKDIDKDHDHLSYRIKRSILGLFDSTNRRRDVENVWADTEAHNRDKMNLTMKQWEQGRKCKDNNPDSDSIGSFTDSNHSTDTLNLEREREYLNTNKEKLDCINDYTDSILRRLERSDVRPEGSKLNIINALLERKNRLTESFYNSFSKQEKVFDQYESIREELKQKRNQDSTNTNTDTNNNTVPSSVTNEVPVRNRGSLIDDFADTSTEPTDYTGGDD